MKPMSSHLKRWITGLAAAPFLILLIFLGGLTFTLLICIVFFASVSEYFRLTFHPESDTISGLLFFLSVLVGSAVLWAAYRNMPGIIIGLISLHLMLCGFFSLSQFKSDPHILRNTAFQIQGFVYIAVSLATLILIRNSNGGVSKIFLLIFVIFAGDIGAFYAGTHLGSHKLCPSVSPSKTIEGSIGGISANIVMGSLLKLFLFPDMAWMSGIIFFAALGIAGQVGDLFESELKRAVKIKDSGSILPGHGGILDRIDALLFAAPVGYLYWNFGISQLKLSPNLSLSVIDTVALYPIITFGRWIF